MTAANFVAWVALMKERGHSAREVARQLGCGVNQIAVWSRKGAPRYIGLAAAAICHGLNDWRLLT